MQPNETLKTIYNRKSVRNFLDKPVSNSLLTELMKAGMAAPTARNEQPWSFIGVTSRELLNELANRLPYAKMLNHAPAAIVVCGVPTVPGADAPPEYWVQDCSAATQNILLAAESLGLGAVWTSAYPHNDRIFCVIQTLGLPDGVIPLNVIPIGYPDGQDKPKDKFKPENIVWNEW